MSKPTLLFFYLLLSTPLLSQQEVIYYEVNYGFIQVGEAQYGVVNTNYQGEPAKKVFVQGNTVGFWDWMYSINDHFRTFIDPNTGYPFYFIREANEGSYRLLRKITFSDTIAEIDGKKYPIKPNTYDIVAAFYRLKKVDWTKVKIGGQIELPVFESKKNYPLILTKLGEETLETEMGNIKTYKLKPKFKKGKVLQDENALVFWVSKKGGYPVKVEFDILLGSFSLEIASVKNLTHNIFD